MTKTTLITTFIFTFLILFHGACSKAPTHDESYSNEQLQKAVDEYLSDKTNILGTIVKVDIPGKKTYEAANGYMDASRTIPIRPNTQFAIGSVTKIFTAVLVYQLIESGHVDPKSPLINYLPPDWSALLNDIAYGNEITVEQALSHRSGMADMTESEAFWKSLFVDPATAWKPLDYLKMVRQKGEVKFKPGDNYNYCNTNYILLGGLIENVSGLSYGSSLQRNILDRIGLKDTCLVEDKFGSINETIARGYSIIDGTLYDGHEISLEWAHATGGIISNAEDLIAFYRALASGDLFDRADTYRQMCRPVGHNESYGRGLEITNDPDIGLYYGHKGNLVNTRAMLAYFPEQRMIISVCHTYHGFSLLHPAELMKSVVQNITGDTPADDAELEFDGPDILADTSKTIVNEDSPIYGEWDFDLREEWRLARLGHHPLGLLGNIHVDDDGVLYLLNRGAAEIAVLNPDGNLMYAFGGHGDGPRFEYPLDLYITTDRIHVLDMGNTGDKIKTYDKNGEYIKTSEIEAGVSLRTFIHPGQYLAVRSGPDVLNRPDIELLELISPGKREGSILTKFAAEEKLILETMLPMGRYIFLEDDINIFPRMIVHRDKNMLFLGRSDKYLIKKVDLSGREQLAFAITGRQRKALPPDYAVNLAGKTQVAGKDMPEEMKDKFVKQFPKRLTFYTKIHTDDRGLIYIYVSNILNLGKQEIDIFSPEGKYLYHAVVELPQGMQRIRPFVFKNECLYVLAKIQNKGNRLIKFKIKTPVVQNN
jgi:D-alanyl-D-alanine carboxypeptidase